jgi:hypothetical protein
MKQTFKITISPTKSNVLPRNLDKIKVPHPPFHMEKEGGVSKGLKTTIEKGIIITNLTKKTPTHPLHLRGWMG